jgi:hypothetical protein
MATDSPPPPEPGPDASIDDIQADIERTREELGETVGALSAKADIKGRAQEKATHAKEAVTEQAAHTKDVIAEKAAAAQSTARERLTYDSDSVRSSALIAASAAVAAVVTIGLVVRRRRR